MYGSISLVAAAAKVEVVCSEEVAALQPATVIVMFGPPAPLLLSPNSSSRHRLALSENSIWRYWSPIWSTSSSLAAG